MGFLTELPSSLSPLLSRAEDMSQPVTTPSSFELASKLEELSGLASQIVRLSNELRAVSPRDFPADSASVCALLPAALSNAQSCLSILQFINQAPISPPSPPSAPSVLDTHTYSPSPTPATVGASRLLPISLGLPLHPRHTPPTEWWPLSLPSTRAILSPLPPSTSGNHSGNEYPPSPPPPSHPTPTRHGVSIADLVDEEDSYTGTRGGVKRSSPPTTTYLSTLRAQYYPPVSVCVVDATPTPKLSTTQASAPSRSPLASSTSNHRRHATNGRRNPPRRSSQEASLVAPEAPGRPVTRSSAKRKAAEDFGVEIDSKRAKTSSP